MFTVYILYSELIDRYYIGQTNDIEKRLVRHNNGYVKSTKAYKPWELVYREEYSTRKEAVNRERELKSKKSKIFLQELIDASRNSG